MSSLDDRPAPLLWPPDRWPRWLPPVLLGATFVAMLSLSWGKWPDVIVDFGHELYAPWQIAAGKVLGRDLAWGASGPLPPYLNAMLFVVFGPGLWTLVAFNLVVLVALTALLFALLRAVGDRFAATLATLTFLAVFAFGQYLDYGNYNYVTPYSHGVTHGMLLSLLALGLIARHARTGSGRALAGAAVALGLVFLAKPEFFAACAGAYAVLLAILVRDAAGAGARFRVLALGTLPGVLPAALAFLLLATRMPAADAMRTALLPWLDLAHPAVQTPFYRSGAGLDLPYLNLARIAAGLAGLGVAVASVAYLDLRFPRGRARALAAALAAGVLVAASRAFMTEARWLAVAQPLPFLLLAGAAWLGWTVLRAPRPCSPARLLHLGLVLFAVVLLSKMALHARLYHYGFVLAMPGALLAITWGAASLPQALERRGGSGWVARAATVVAVALLSVAYVQRAMDVWEGKEIVVASGRDAFWADERGAFVNSVLESLGRSGAPEGTLVVLPEGVMVNYLARRETPSRYLTHLPDAMARWGEASLLAALQARPPDFVLVVQRDAAEHGARKFGRDYGSDIMSWVRGRYREVRQFGSSPVESDWYGIVLFRLRDADPGGSRTPGR